MFILSILNFWGVVLILPSEVSVGVTHGGLDRDNKPTSSSDEEVDDDENENEEKEHVTNTS